MTLLEYMEFLIPSKRVRTTVQMRDLYSKQICTPRIFFKIFSGRIYSSCVLKTDGFQYFMNWLEAFAFYMFLSSILFYSSCWVLMYLEFVPLINFMYVIYAGNSHIS